MRAAEAPSHAGGHNLLGAVALQHHGALPAWERPSVCSSSGVRSFLSFKILDFEVSGSRAVVGWFVLVQDESARLGDTGAR